MPPEGAQVRYIGLRRANVLAGAVRWGPRASKWTVFGPFRIVSVDAFLLFFKFQISIGQGWGPVEPSQAPALAN